MTWHERPCSGCGQLAALADNPDVRMLCPACCPGDPLFRPPGTIPDCLTVGGFREALQYFMELGGAWGSNLGAGKYVLLEGFTGLWQVSPKVRASFRHGRIVLVLETAGPYQ
jgi:hypothetical protein